MSANPTKARLLDIITQFYRESRDFNGIPMVTLLEQSGIGPEHLREILAQLVNDGKVSAVFGDIHPNPHIRALYDEPVEQQMSKLQTTKADGACFYPTPAHLRTLVDVSTYQDRPFMLKLALGEPQLAYYAFDLSVLEIYRNDPRYRYDHDDISGRIGITDAHYRAGTMPERDQILLKTFGFAYNDDLNRAVAVFLRYLADLTPEHQQIWNAKILGTHPEWKLHPDYYRPSILGAFPERISIFEAFTQELRAINEMCSVIGWPPLFRNDFTEDKKPRGFGFLIRLTVREFNDFVLLLDKMISENLSRDFFAGVIPLEHEEERSDGKVVIRQKGTVQLLGEWLHRKFRTPDPKPLDEMIAAFREVRQLRQRPAHAPDEDVFDQAVFQRQRELMIRVYDGVRTLRLLLANHPRAREYKVNDTIREGKIWTY